jgi:hypothetical protein
MKLSAILRPLKLFAMMSVTAVFGWACGVAVLVPGVYQYDHGYGETEKCGLAGAIIGALFGLVAYLLSTQRDSQSHRSSWPTQDDAATRPGID